MKKMIIILKKGVFFMTYNPRTYRHFIAGAVSALVIWSGTAGAASAEEDRFADKEADNPYNDVPEDKYYTDPVLFMTEGNLIEGMGDGSFGTGEDLTRADAAVLLARVLGYENGDSSGDPSFTDVDEEDYFYDEVAAAAEMGIIEGHTDDTFRPEETLSRGEMSIIMTRAFDLPPAQEEVPFTDIDGNFYEEEIGSIYEEGLTDGYPDNTFRPDNDVKREDFATFLFREEGVQDKIIEEMEAGEETNVSISNTSTERNGEDPVAAVWNTGQFETLANGDTDGEFSFNGVTLTVNAEESVDGYTISEPDNRSVELNFDASEYRTSGQQVDLFIEALEAYQDSANEELDRFSFDNANASGGRALEITGDPEEGSADNDLTITTNDTVVIGNDDASSITVSGADGTTAIYQAGVQNEAAADGTLTISTWDPETEVSFDVSEGDSPAVIAEKAADALSGSIEGYDVSSQDNSIVFTASTEEAKEEPLQLQAVDQAASTEEGDPEVNIASGSEDTVGTDPVAARWDTGQFEARDNGIENGEFTFNGVTVFIETTEQEADYSIETPTNRAVELTFNADEYSSSAQQVDLLIEALETYQSQDNDHLDRFSFENTNADGGRALAITNAEERGSDDNELTFTSTDNIVIGNDGSSSLARAGEEGTESVVQASVQNEASASGTITITTENPSASAEVDVREGDAVDIIAVKAATALDGGVDGYSVTANGDNIVFTAEEEAENENPVQVSVN
nr:hypothetical protein FTX54_13840 [Alkalicoccus halolimnae]